MKTMLKLLESIVEEININIEYPYWTVADGTEDICQGRLEFANMLFNDISKQLPTSAPFTSIGVLLEKLLEQQEIPEEHIEFSKIEEEYNTLAHYNLPDNLINIWDYVEFPDKEEKEEFGDYATVNISSIADYIEEEIHKDPANKKTNVEFKGVKTWEGGH
tara:strand:+ start:189 stop:671 length:483 start_codon:yes stop_codon:yes gene_type:complete